MQDKKWDQQRPGQLPPVPVQAAAPKPHAKMGETKPPAAARPPNKQPHLRPRRLEYQQTDNRAQLLTPIPKRPGSSLQPLPPRASPRQGSVASLGCLESPR